MWSRPQKPRKNIKRDSEEKVDLSFFCDFREYLVVCEFSLRNTEGGKSVRGCYLLAS